MSAIGIDNNNGAGMYVPKTLPASVAGPLTELGPDTPNVCYVDLESDEVQAIDDALTSFKSLEIDGQNVCKDNFALPASIEAKMKKAALVVHRGTGVCVIRGLTPSRYNEADNLTVFLGLAHYIGDKHGLQDRKGNVISHITDSKAWSIPYEQRHGAHTNRPLKWHCDMGADVLALQVRQVAAQGGATLVSSSWKVYNELMKERPDVVQALATPDWPVHMPKSKGSYVLAPIIDFEQGNLLINFDPSRLGAHPKQSRSAVPALTDVQTEALEVLSAAAGRNGVELDSKAGDLIFLNNWAIMHARGAYVDAEDAADEATRRHLLRLWLRNSELGWEIPTSMRGPWETVFGYTDEGYISGDREQTPQLKYAVVPESNYKPARYAMGSAAFVIEDSDGDSDDE